MNGNIENEKIICTAYMEAKLSKTAKALSIALATFILLLSEVIYNIAGGGEAGSTCVTVIFVTCMLFVVPILIMTVIRKHYIKNFYLKLSENTVIAKGMRQVVGRSQQYIVELVRLPIDKVDSIGVSKTLLWDGQIVTVRTASDAIRFMCVQNANEFVSATLAKMEEFKQSVIKENENTAIAITQNDPSSSSSSSVSKIKELKELLDGGLITQEEFNAKRKELLDKM